MDIALDAIWLSKLPTGGRVVVTELEGWWDTPEPNLLDDGEPDPQEPWLPRIISITGNVHASSHDELHESGELLNGLLRKKGILTVQGHGPTMNAEVTRSARTRFTTVTDRVGIWSATLRARDPLKYGGWQVPVTLANDVRTEGIFHRGNTDSPPMVRITGSSSGGYTISHEDGLFFEVLAPIWTGQQHVVDFSTGRVYRDGVPLSDYGSARLISIHPGPSQAVRLRFHEGGNGAGYIDVQDVWI